MPDPFHERPSTMKQRARRLLHQAARLAADASTFGESRRADIARMHDEAHTLIGERQKKLMDLERAVSHPATRHTAQAWGAREGEPLFAFPGALRRTLLELGVAEDMADELVDSSEDLGEGKKGGKKGGGEKGKGKR